MAVDPNGGRMKYRLKLDPYCAVVPLLQSLKRAPVPGITCQVCGTTTAAHPAAGKSDCCQLWASPLPSGSRRKSHSPARERSWVKQVGRADDSGAAAGKANAGKVPANVVALKAQARRSLRDCNESAILTGGDR